MKKNDVKLISTIPFKLKDKVNRNFKAFKLEALFGFVPESIIISKQPGKSNTFVLSAIVPKEKK